MKDLDFYIVQNSYITYLQKAESIKRGFTRVPNMDYGKNHKPKFICGIVLEINAVALTVIVLLSLEINDVSYFVPVSSYKFKKPDNFLICDKNGNTISSLRFNYMFPVPLKIIKQRRIDIEPDLKYRALLAQELKYCKDNQDTIRNLAKRTHKRVMLAKSPTLVKNSCDFSLLEQKCQEYKDQLLQTQQPILPNQIPPVPTNGFTQGI